jgi:enoyl-CoA hydratase/carnithine racemase
VAVVRLEQPGKPVVVLDLELIQRLEATLKSLPKDTVGMVLASASDRVFVAGADLKTISEWDDQQLDAYLAFGARVFGMISWLPYPTAAAINGAALGGGLEVAMHCDGLIAAPPRMKDGQPGKAYPVGLPEAGLGLCPGWGGTNLLPARMDAAAAIRRTATGQTMTFDEANAAGLFDVVAPSQEQLIETAIAWVSKQRGVGTYVTRQRSSGVVVERRPSKMERTGEPLRWIGRPDRAGSVLKALDEVKPELPATEAAAAVGAAVDAGLARGWAAAVESERKSLVQLRHTPAAKTALAAFFAKK